MTVSLHVVLYSTPKACLASATGGLAPVPEGLPASGTFLCFHYTAPLFYHSDTRLCCEVRIHHGVDGSKPFVGHYDHLLLEPFIIHRGLVLYNVTLFLGEVGQVAHVPNFSQAHPERLKVLSFVGDHGPELFPPGKHRVESLELVLQGADTPTGVEDSRILVLLPVQPLLDVWTKAVREPEPLLSNRHPWVVQPVSQKVGLEVPFPRVELRRRVLWCKQARLQSVITFHSLCWRAPAAAGAAAAWAIAA